MAVITRMTTYGPDNPDRLPPRFLIDNTPGARSALDHWRRTQEAFDVARAKAKADRPEPVRTVWKGEPGNAYRAPAPGVTQAQLDAEAKADRERDAALAPLRAAVPAARKEFDRLIAEACAAPEIRQLSAATAIEKDADAKRLWTELRAVLDDRDSAIAFAKVDSRRMRQSAAVVNREDQEASIFMDRRVNDFDAPVFEIVADGEDAAK